MEERKKSLSSAEENKASEAKIHSPPHGKKPLMSAPKYNQNWQCRAGKGPQLKLCLNYWRLQENEMDEDTCLYKIHCYIGFLTCWNFYNQTFIGRKLLDAIVSKHNCHVELSKDMKLQGFFIFKISDKPFEKESDVKRFVEVVLDDVNMFAQQQLCLDLVSVNQEIQDDVRQKIEHTEELGQCLWIEFGGKYDPETMYTVCLQEKQSFCQQQITYLIRDANDCFYNHEEMIPLDFIWQKVMIEFSYLQKIKDIFPQIIIVSNEEATAFVLRGPKDVLRAAKNDLLALLESAHKEVHEVSFAPLCEFEIFSHQEMCDYINQAIPKVPIVWIPNHETKKIHLFARNPEQLQGIDKSIMSCVKEKCYPMSKDASMLSHETSRSFEELKKKYMGKIVVQSSKTGLFVTTADDLFESVDATVGEIISRERDVDEATHVPKKADERDKPLGNKTDPATTDGHKETNDLPSKKGIEPIIVRTVVVKNKNVFHKLLEEIQSCGQDHHVTVQGIETCTRVGFKLIGSRADDIEYVFQDITQRVALEEQRLQAEQGSGESVSDTTILEEKMTRLGPCNTGQSQNNIMSGSIFKSIQVKVQKGQLHEAQAEVLVNTVNKNLDLRKGAISSSLLAKAGNGIQRELQQYKQNFVFGQVLKTGVCSLLKPCKVVFHGVLFAYKEHSDCLEVFEDFICDCLEEANKKFSSIAFPPIGTGGLGYPKDFVASIMFRSVAKFAQAHLTSKLKDVIFVIYEKDQETLMVFEEMYGRCVGTTVADKPNAKPAFSVVSKMLKYGQVQVQARLGDFENENQNCLLVLWKKQCLYAITDKNRILHSAGSAVTQKWIEHRNARQFHQDVVLVTPGGKLRYIEIIHVASEFHMISTAVQSGLMKADSEKMETVVIPINIDDVFLRDINRLCIGILAAVKELAMKLKSVKSINLIIQGRHNFRFFNDVFEQESTEKKTAIADLQEERTPKPTSEEKTPHSSTSAAETRKQLDWRCNDGNPHVISLLIKYLRRWDKETHSDFFKYVFSCNLNFQLMWNFYTQTECGKKMLDAIVAIHHCQVSLPADDHFKEIIIFQVSDTQFCKKSDVRGFVDGVIDHVYKCAQELLSIDSFSVDPRIGHYFQERLEQKKELDCAWIKFVGEGNPVTVFTVCQKENQQWLMQIIKKVLVDTEDSFYNHEEMVAVDCIRQTLLNKFGYLKEMSDKFPDTKIDQNEETNAFLLKGPRDEVKAAAGHIKKLLMKACEEVHEELLTLDCHFKIFTYPEMCDYVDNLISDLSAVWIPNQLTQKIHVFSRKHSQLIAKAIKGCVQERLYPMSKDHFRHMSEKVGLVRKELKKKYRGKFVVHQSDAGLLVTAADDIFGSVDYAIQEIIGQQRDNANYAHDLDVDRDGQMSRKTETDTAFVNPLTKCLISEKDTAPEKVIIRTIEVKNIFKKIVEKNLSELEQMAREHGITICKIEKQNRLGFKLEGIEKEVEFVYRYLVERIGSGEQEIYPQKDIISAGETENMDEKASSGLVDIGLKVLVTSEKVPAPCTETTRTYLHTVGDAMYTPMKTMQDRPQQSKTMAGKDVIKVPDEDTDVLGSCPSVTNLSEVDQDDSIVYIECKIEVAEDVLNSIMITYGQQGIDSLISDLDQLAKVDTHEGSILVLCDYKYAENVQKCVRNHYNKAKEERKIKIKEENKHLIHGGNDNLMEWLQFAYGHASWSKNLQLEGGKLYLTGTLQIKREVEKAVHSMNYWYQEEFTLSSEEQQKADEVVAVVKSELPKIFIKHTKETMIVLSDNRDNFERANYKVKVALGRIKITARERRL